MKILLYIVVLLVVIYGGIKIYEQVTWSPEPLEAPTTWVPIKEF